ncbi:MAG: zf-HC2 domain-containing protein [Firmicutes bacterium]|nr:zf-HC2 domain-containing protein [Bacillota bacterium]
MNKITCDMCIDLMPLVQDGVASEDSVKAVTEHLTSCPSCSALFEGQIPEPSNKSNILKQMQKQLYTFMSMVLMCGVLFGLSLTASNELFYNTLIMPFVGLVGYGMFRFKSAYIIPCLLFLAHFITNAFNWIRGLEFLDTTSLLLWSGIYSVFAVIGITIAALIHFALKKENK